MSLEIRESDWRIFRDLHPIMMERFFETAATEMEKVLSQGGQTSKDRFWVAFDLAKKRRQDAAELFDDFRRSTALLQLALIYRRKCVTEEELSRFSADAQTFVQGILSLNAR